MLLNIDSATPLADAKRQLRELEEQYGIKTEEVLSASTPGEVAAIDGFDLIEWHFYAEQIRVFEGSRSVRGYQYQSLRSRRLLNAPEREYELVA